MKISIGILIFTIMAKSFALGEVTQKDCSDLEMQLSQMQEAQRQIMTDLSSRQDLFASTLESYQESLLNTYKKKEVIQLSSVKNMQSSVEDIREAGLKSNQIVQRYLLLSNQLLQTTSQCLKSNQQKSKN